MNASDRLLGLAFMSIAQVCFRSQAESILRDGKVLASTGPELDRLRSVICALILAEDHRFGRHFGIDSRAIVRALLLTIFARRLQGGSTITQQLVRSISGDYRRTITRKLKELCLAAWLDAKLAKDEQTLAYLNVAYFGWRMTGITQAATRLGISFPCSDYDAASIIARLKYPEPKEAGERRRQQIAVRQLHILTKITSNREQSSGT
jgi:membrane carboxypeptidase/penicillin-binding protein